MHSCKLSLHFLGFYFLMEGMSVFSARSPVLGLLCMLADISLMSGHAWQMFTLHLSALSLLSSPRRRIVSLIHNTLSVYILTDVLNPWFRMENVGRKEKLQCRKLD